MKKKKGNKDHIKILRYFYNIKIWLGVLAILMLLLAVVNVFNPIVSAKLLTSITEFNIKGAFIFSILFLIVSLASIIINELTNVVYLKKLKNMIIYNIRKDMVKNIFEMKTINFDKHTSGELSERLKSDPEAISSVLGVVQYSSLCMLTDLIVLIYVFYLNIVIGLLYLLCVIFVYFYEKNAFKKYEHTNKITSQIKDRNATLLNESMRGIRDIKILNISNPIYTMICKNLNESTECDSKMNLQYIRITDTVEIVKAITTVLVVACGIYLVSIEKLTVTSLLVIFMYRTNIYDLVLCYTSIKDYYTKYKVSSSRIFEIMNKKKFPKENFGNEKLENINGKIEIKNLTFSYDKESVLNDISLTIEPNDTVAIVGASGSGKTTLFNLLSKSYDVDNDSIFIDDVDINKLSKDSIRDNISVITQSPYLFNLSIKDNLKLMGDNVKDKDIIEACKIAQIHDFIQTLPHKYNTIIGEGGVNLSGGQRQRIAIARALIKKSKIILFDEATSALDNITQKEIQKSINNISADYTIIIVAHRLSTIKECSRIYVMDKGKIVGVGTHKELLENNKYYKQLYNQELV